MLDFYSDSTYNFPYLAPSQSCFKLFTGHSNQFIQARRTFFSRGIDHIAYFPSRLESTIKGS